MSEKKVFLSHDGLTRLEAELHELKTVARRDIAEEIKEARGQGDLSENAEYHAAKEKQVEIENRITEIEKTLRNAEVIDEENTHTDSVSLGCCVVIFDEAFGEEMEYHIVGSVEADPAAGKISNESPVGQAILGKKCGEKVDVSTPNGVISLKVLSIKQMRSNAN